MPLTIPAESEGWFYKRTVVIHSKGPEETEPGLTALSVGDRATLVGTLEDWWTSARQGREKGMPESRERPWKSPETFHLGSLKSIRCASIIVCKVPQRRRKAHSENGKQTG